VSRPDRPPVTGDGATGGAGERRPSDPLVEATGLTVELGGVEVLSGIDFAARSGRLVGLVGPNGAGKTTLLRALRGSLPLAGGTVRIADGRIGELGAREAARLVASVPQNTSLSFEFTVEQVVEMGRHPHLPRFGARGPADRRAVERAMERTDVARFADRPITAVSGGERQRVLLARALAQDTPVLLLDEPTSSLDINHAVGTLELVRELVAEGKTAVAAIHDLDLAARYCDKLVLLENGTVTATGPPREVLTPEAVGRAFDATAVVTGQPAAAAPGVTALPATGGDGTVHVLGGGRRAALAVRRLAGAGFDVSVGPVHEGSAAATAAAEVGAPAVTVPAFSRLDSETRGEAREAAAGSDCVVLAGESPVDPPPGPPAVGLADGTSAAELVDAVTAATGGEP